MAIVELLARLADCANWDSSGGGLSAQRAAAIGSAILDSLAESGETCMIQPVGSVTAYAGNLLPDGWLWCDGSEHLSADYPELVEVMDGFFSEVGFSTFTTPDLRDRFIYGAQFPGYQGDTGGTGGTATETLTLSQIPAHTHGMNHNHGYYGRTNATAFGSTNRAAMAGTAGGSAQQSTLDASTPNTGSQGGGQPHNNIPPFLKLSYIIRAR